MWAALTALVVMEVVPGIDNLAFISILSNNLPEVQRARTQWLGIALALVIRPGLLDTVALIVRLTYPLFHAFGHGFSWRDLILIAGGPFLVRPLRKSIITLRTIPETRPAEATPRRFRHGPRLARS